MSMLEQLSDEACWERFYAYKTSLACPKTFAKELRRFIDARGWEPVCEEIRKTAEEIRQSGSAGDQEITFPLPSKAVISKQSSQKKRTVYTYPAPENTVLKLLTWLLLRKYDGLFSGNLYSFRPGITAKDAVRRLRRTKDINRMYSYKADISNYFNSVPVEKLLPMLSEALAEDPALLNFLSGLLTEPRVLDGSRGITEPRTPEESRIIIEQKGIMAGTPLSAFYANLYLRDLDRSFADRGIPYARYSDDIILFAKTAEERDAYAEEVGQFLAERGLSMNPDKEVFGAPEDGFTFLGFEFREGYIDIAPVSVVKLKKKMRRKARALDRWHRRKGLSGEKAAAAFLRVFNRKLFAAEGDNELSWNRWFFPVITRTDRLHEIDLYAQDCIRFLAAGTRTKARFDVRYEDLKRLGYRSLVHEWYENEVKERNAQSAQDIQT